MPDDIYDDAGMSESAPEKAEPESNSSGSPEELLSRSFFGDKELEIGKRCEVEIVKLMPDQVLVKKVPDSEYKEKPEPMMERDEVSEMMD